MSDIVSDDPRRDLGDQVRYSAHLLTLLEEAQTQIRRVDQKYGPFSEFDKIKARMLADAPAHPEGEAL